MFNDQESQKNLLLAIVLSMAVLMAWQFLYVWPRQEQERQARLRLEETKVKEKQAAPGTAKTDPTAKADQTTKTPPVPSSTPAPPLNRQAALDLSPRVGIESPSYKGSISLKGGRIDDLVLAKYREQVDPK